jgi:hypothetical protein
MMIGASAMPGYFSQYLWWFTHFIPVNVYLQNLGVAAIRWAIWKVELEHVLKEMYALSCKSQCAQFMYF